MVLRNIVKIDEEKCNGCGECVSACAEGAIEIINGKARLVSETYCDGLGACLGHCPQDAISVEQREANEFDEKATSAHLSGKKESGFVCPGMMSQSLEPGAAASNSISSQLSQWPVQLKLLSPQASFLADSDLLLVADCVAFAMPDFHARFLKGKSIAVGCPKLDDGEYYIDKFSEILKVNKLKSLAVIHMEVPCCSGLTQIAKQAIIRSNASIPFEDVTIDLWGNVLCRKTVKA